MKKLFILLLTLCLTLTALCAQAETTNIVQLRESAPRYYQTTVQTDDGRTVEIMAPIILPTGDAIPVLRCHQAAFDTSNIRERYPLDPDLPQYARIAATYWDAKDTVLLTCGTTDFGWDGTHVRRKLEEGEMAPGVTVGAEEAKAIVLRECAEYDCEIVPELTLEDMIGYAEGYSISAGTWDSANTKAGTTAGMERGCYIINFAQVLRGVRILPTWTNNPDRSAAVDERGDIEMLDFRRAKIGVTIGSTEDYSLLVMLLAEDEVIEEDSALLPLEEIVKVVEDRVRSGELRSVYALTLGYAAYLESGYPGGQYHMEDGEEVNTPQSTAKFVLRPVWRVDGYDIKEANGTVEEKNRYHVLYDKNAGDPDYELLIDAVTGELVTSFREQMRQ